MPRVQTRQLLVASMIKTIYAWLSVSKLKTGLLYLKGPSIHEDLVYDRIFLEENSLQQLMSYVLWGYKCSSKNTIPSLPSENKYWCVVECHLKIIFEIPCRKSLVKEKLTNINWHKSTQTHYIDIRLKIHLMTERNIHYTGKVIVTIDLIWIKPSTNAISYFLTRRWNSF